MAGSRCSPRTMSINVERKKAALALARFMRLHPHNIAQKTEVMVEHFQAVTRHKIGGRATDAALAATQLVRDRKT